MPLKRQFICCLPSGMHARPASLLEATAREFASEIILVNERNGRAINAKSVLAIISADIRDKDACTLNIRGPDEQEANVALSAYIDEKLPHCDDATTATTKIGSKPDLPVMVRGEGVRVYRGAGVVGGVAFGRIIRVGAFKIPATLLKTAVTDVNAELAKLELGLQKLIEFYDRRATGTKKKIELDLIAAHRAMARDMEFQRQLRSAILERHQTAAGAIGEAEKHFSNMLGSTGSVVLQERALDIQDICFGLLKHIYGEASGREQIQLESDAIIVAEALTPGQFLGLDRNFLKGLALASAGTTSHTVILARSFGIPTLTGVHEIAGIVRLENEEAVLDAEGGTLLTNLTEGGRRYYAMEQKRFGDRQARVQRFTMCPAETRDGHPIEIGANIATAEEASAAFVAGAEGVGLFRTEMLFLDRDSTPDETEQFEIYRRTLAAAGNRAVIIRTLDAGGDKPLCYLDLPEEENPFLGIRGVRLYAKFEALFRTQVRALVRASAHGKLKLLLPMIATVDEARWTKKIILDEQQKCAVEKIPFDPRMPVGAMVEVPSAAFIIDALSREMDFFSIGANDLLQYCMAADRGNAGMKSLYDPLQPAFLRLLKQIVDAAKANKRWIGLCGEAAGEFLPLMIGLGLDEIGVSTPRIAGLKAQAAELSYEDCRQLLAAAVDSVTAEEVAALLKQFAVQRTVPLTESDLMVFNSDAQTREEAIKQAADRLYVTGRTENSRAVEEAVWEREQTYSTGFGNGFAIPHCKTDAIRFSSLAILKLRTPVGWNSLDGQPVRVAVLFAAVENGANEHMKIFAKLARLMMDDHFRERIENETDPDALCDFLCDTLKMEKAAARRT